ncbi:MAG: hypothetical protein AB7O45_11770 [Alphaproteobacteria bacterium]
MTALRRLWRGEVPLNDAFWNWAVLGGLAVNVSTSIAFLALISADLPYAALFVGYVLSVPYNIVVAVGVWRAADAHPGDRRWAETVRYVTAIGMTILSVT